MSFETWRQGLILHGEELFGKFLIDADSLAEIDDIQHCSELLNLSNGVFNNRNYPLWLPAPTTIDWGDSLKFRYCEWRNLFPRLCAKYWTEWHQSLVSYMEQNSKT